LFLGAFLCFSFLFIWRQREPNFGGRTVEQWLRSDDWTTRQGYVAQVIIDFEDQGAAALQKILLRKGAAREEAILAALPFARLLNGSRLTRAEMKERVITGLESLEMTGLKCIPTLIKVAQNQNEPLRVRQLAIRTLSRISGDDSTKVALSFLINDANVGFDAAQALAEIERRRQHQQETSEIHRVRRQMDERDTRVDDLTTRTSLWEQAEPGVRWRQ
jgi:hypothetical protein